MKTLKAVALINEKTDTNNLKIAVSDFNQIHLEINENVENVITDMQLGKYDMLLVDKGLYSAELKKVNKVSDVLFPQAAVVNMSLQDEDFIRFKLNTMLSKWNEANQEAKINYIDNPSLSS